MLDRKKMKKKWKESSRRNKYKHDKNLIRKKKIEKKNRNKKRI